MARQLKSWESPRRQGRNSKGAGGSARARQLKKQRSMLVKKLKGQDPNRSQEKGNTNPFSFFVILSGYCDMLGLVTAG